MKELEAIYNAYSTWNLEELGLDLDKVHEWWVKWDTLHVIRTKGSKMEEFLGSYSDSSDNPDVKRPACLSIDNEEVWDL
jgi:hypothetical protein